MLFRKVQRTPSTSEILYNPLQELRMKVSIVASIMSIPDCSFLRPQELHKAQTETSAFLDTFLSRIAPPLTR